MRYAENNLIAAIAHDAGTYRTVVMGFPFETITKASQRSDLMKQVLSFLTNTTLKKNVSEQIFRNTLRGTVQPTNNMRQLTQQP